MASSKMANFETLHSIETAKVPEKKPNTFPSVKESPTNKVLFVGVPDFLNNTEMICLLMSANNFKLQKLHYLKNNSILLYFSDEVEANKVAETNFAELDQELRVMKCSHVFEKPNEWEERNKKNAFEKTEKDLSDEVQIRAEIDKEVDNIIQKLGKSGAEMILSILKSLQNRETY